MKQERQRPHTSAEKSAGTEELQQLKAARDAAIRSAQNAVYNTTRLTRLLTILSESGSRDQLLEKVLSTLSELFAADIVFLVDPAGTGSFIPLAAVGLPEDLSGGKLSDGDGSYTLTAIRGLTPILNAAVQEDANADPPLRQLGVETAVWLPVVGSDAARGVLVLARCRPDPFIQSDVSLLSAMAHRIGLMLEQAQHGVQMEQIVQAGREIGRLLDEKSVITEVVSHFPAIIGADASALVLIEPDGQSGCVAQSGLDPELNPVWCCLADEFLHDDRLSDAPHNISSVNDTVEKVPGCISLSAGPVRALLSVPIRQGQSTVGQLFGMRFSIIPFSADTLQVAMLYAAQASAALDNARLYRALQDELGERERAERALRISHERFQSMIRSVFDVITILGEDGSIHYANPAVENVWGCTVESLIGQSIIDRIHPDDEMETRSQVEDLLKRPRETLTGVGRLRYGHDQWRYFEVVLTNMLDDPAVGGIVATFHDITERKRYEQELTNLAYRDPLTGLANRAYFIERLKQSLAYADLNQRSVAVIYFDLDNFKVINDSLGHDWGDEVLRVMASRVRAILHPEDTAARLGGDEFTILLENVLDRDEVVALVNRMMNDFRNDPMNLQGHDLFISCSVGIALSTPNEDTTDELLRKADLAMYVSKANGKGCYEIFDTQMNVTAMERLEMEADLRRALINKELRVFYQPVVALENGLIAEVEALTHWEHPRKGPLSPAEIIPLAKETGLIFELGQWVLRESCRQVRSWKSGIPGCSQLGFSINLSSRQLRQPDFIKDIQTALMESQMPASSLMVECTESSLANDPTTALAKLGKIKDLGARVCIDNFGQDFMSLKYLNQYSIDTIKISPFLVQAMEREERDQAILRSVIDVSQALGIRVIGVGIETKGQARVLLDMGCRFGQGKLYAPAMPVEQLEPYLEKGIIF